MYFTHPQLKNLKPLFKKTSEAKLKQKLAKFFPNQEIIFTDLGRSAFQLAIKNLKLENSEMLVPAYICDIFKPIFKHYHIRPVYLDIDLKNFNIQISKIEKKLTSKTKSVLVCHTYGLPAEMDKILKIAKKHNLKIIEDCAHLPPFGLPRAESRGDCTFFSFSKLCPTINGGMIVCKKPIKSELKKYKSKFSNLIKSARLFPSSAKFLEKFRSGDMTLATKEFSMPRKASKKSLGIFKRYLDTFKKQIYKREELAKYFQENLQKIGFRPSPGITYISTLVPKNINRDKLFKKLRKKGIFCSRIWHKPIFPNLPNTSEAAKRIINFPLQNWFTKKDIDKIIREASNYLVRKE
jgi:dTDP-4-amino-4,6-dideoxygalactose transaminase